MAIHGDEAAALERATVIGSNGEQLGTVDGILYDNATEAPSWAAVKSGLFGHAVSFVPFAGASVHDGELRVPFGKEQIATAPHHDPGQDLSPLDEAALLRHYGVSSETTFDGGPDAETSTHPTADRTTIAADQDVHASEPADGAMTRSEERLRVHTESRAVERVRLRKRIVTEYEQITVPLRHEELTVERVSIDESDTTPPHDAGLTGAGLTGAGPTGGSVAGHRDPDVASSVDGDQHEIILYAERPVVRVETVAVERIRAGKRTVTGEETVGAQVRREEVELDTDCEPHEPR